MLDKLHSTAPWNGLNKELSIALVDAKWTIWSVDIFLLFFWLKFRWKFFPGENLYQSGKSALFVTIQMSAPKPQILVLIDSLQSVKTAGELCGLAPQMIITKETKWHLSCCSHDNSFAAGPVLIKISIPSFGLNQRPCTPVNLSTKRIKTILEPWSSQAGPSVPFFFLKSWKSRCFVFERKKLEPR